MKKIDVLYVVLDIGLTLENSAVFQAQVLDQLMAQHEQGIKVGVICGYRSFDAFENLVMTKLGSVDGPIYYYQSKIFILDVIRTIFLLCRATKRYKIRGMYARSLWAAVVMRLMPRQLCPKYHYDCRGDVLDEQSAAGKSPLNIWLMSRLEKIAISGATTISCVTGVLAETISKRNSLENKPEVIPSCISLKNFRITEGARFNKREELGFSQSSIVFVYSGGLASYQKVPEMLNIWGHFLNHEHRIQFLMLVNFDPVSLANRVEGLERFGDRIKVARVARDKVFETLLAADIGFILREDRPLNASASPVKFAEYLAAGLGIISSPNVGDMSRHIKECDIGTLVNPNALGLAVEGVSGFVDEYVRHRQRIREKARDLLVKRYCWEAYQNHFAERYMTVKDA